MSSICFWMDPRGELFPCSTHEEFAIKYITKRYGNKGINGPFYCYEILESEKWIRLKISKHKIYMYDDLRKITDKQRKEVKDLSTEKHLIIEDHPNTGVTRINTSIGGYESA